jgi:hypothetical protein
MAEKDFLGAASSGSVNEMGHVYWQGGLWDAPGSFPKQTSLITWDSKFLADIFPGLSPVG